MGYNGRVQRIENKAESKNRYFDWVKLIVWYIGTIVSLMPVGIEALVYLATNETLDKTFWLKICTKGDVLWIFATLLVLTLVECYTGSVDLESKSKKWLGLGGTVLWGISFAVWIVFKYIYSDDYMGDIVIGVCSVIGVATLIICTALQGHFVEVEK